MIGAPCALFGLIPPVGYGVLNVGVLALLLIGAALLFAGFRWERMGRRLRRVCLVVFALGGAYVLGMSAWMAAGAWGNPPPAEEPVAVVVLGAKVNGDQPSLTLRHRLGAALDYLNEHPSVICVVSGGQGADELYPEAHVMAAWLTARGVDPDRILIEDRSTNTRENLAFSAALLVEAGLPADRVAIATDSFHQLRAALFGRALGLRCYAVPCVSPWGLFPAYWMRELLALPVALLQSTAYPFWKG